MAVRGPPLQRGEKSQKRKKEKKKRTYNSGQSIASKGEQEKYLTFYYSEVR